MMLADELGPLQGPEQALQMVRKMKAAKQVFRTRSKRLLRAVVTIQRVWRGYLLRMGMGVGKKRRHRNGRSPQKPTPLLDGGDLTEYEAWGMPPESPPHVVTRPPP